MYSPFWRNQRGNIRGLWAGQQTVSTHVHRLRVLRGADRGSEGAREALPATGPLLHPWGGRRRWCGRGAGAVGPAAGPGLQAPGPTNVSAARPDGNQAAASTIQRIQIKLEVRISAMFIMNNGFVFECKTVKDEWLSEDGRYSIVLIFSVKNVLWIFLDASLNI